MRTGTCPIAVCTGITTLRVVSLTTVTLLDAIPPKLTIAPDRKPVPVIVIASPPVLYPDAGSAEVAVGF